ncbi:MAG: TonB-dependent receptor [Siphonobacter aquaeclarae]|nr:TonB-dependent receptor [Siphonobacter aquaeclarae]
MKRLLFLVHLTGTALWSCLTSTTAQAQSAVVLRGTVRDAQTGVPIPGVAVAIRETRGGTLTDTTGAYFLSFSKGGEYHISYSSIGYQTATIRVRPGAGTAVHMNLKTAPAHLQEVIVTGQSGASSRVSETVQMSGLSIPMQQIREIPSVLGEKDVLKALQLMPGVQKSAEGTTGLYVRGGGPDQNLVLLDGIPIYHTSHLFGFFSLFNGDAIQSVNLMKGGFPARFGGRLSSVIEMQMREGDFQRFRMEGGIGLISSRLSLETPIQKGKSSFLFSARRTYADLAIRPFLSGMEERNGYFYDLNGKLSFHLGPKDKLTLSGYWGNDYFKYATEGTISRERGHFVWGNGVGGLRWTHAFRPSFLSTVSLLFTHYHSAADLERNVISDNNKKVKYFLHNESTIYDYTAKADFQWLPGTRHQLQAGFQLTSHQFNPSSVTSTNEYGLKPPSRASAQLDSWEGAAYIEDTYQPTTRLRINAGLRYSAFRSKKKYYFQPEPRLSLAYQFPGNWAVKASYASMNQYIHLLSNSGIGLPTDLWIPSTDRTPPQRSQQAALGLAKDLRPGIAVTLEGFYKRMEQMVAYKEGASSLSYDDTGKWEDQLTYGRGWSYGAEFLLQKKTGKLTGWLGYTLSWTRQQFDELNFGREFWARYDRRHDISLVGIYHVTPRLTLSATWVYGTNQAFTLPRGQYWIQGTPALTLLGDAKDYYTGRVFQEYGNRNSFRTAPFHHLDLGIQFRKAKGRLERTWEISVYNVYNRQNPSFYYFDTVNTSTEAGVKNYQNKLKQVTLFPILPSVSYGFRF